MTESHIQERLRLFFDNHRYILTNSYVFNWESDFFSVTKTGTVYEVEIKISKSDFKKDFEKDKHVLFRNAINKKQTFTVEAYNWGRGDLLMMLKVGFLKVRNRRFDMSIDESFTDAEDSFGYWQLRDRFVTMDYVERPLYAPICNFRYHKLSELSIPNRFYYCCPEGLIQPEDLPSYAGLLYASERGVRMVKQAPFIVKSNILEKLRTVLLDKFWYLSVKYRGVIRMKEMANS